VRLLYKPFALIASLLAGRIGRAIFRGLWSRIDSADPPAATAPNASLPKVVGAAALEAATMASVAAAADRVSARAFEWLTGVWPGKEPKEKE
jgi:chitodextrinase